MNTHTRSKKNSKKRIQEARKALAESMRSLLDLLENKLSALDNVDQDCRALDFEEDIDTDYLRDGLRSADFALADIEDDFIEELRYAVGDALDAVDGVEEAEACDDQ